MAVYRPDIPPHVADVIRHLPPDLKRSIRQALRVLSENPLAGEPLLRKLEGTWKYRVRRFRIIYSINRARRMIRILAVGRRTTIYEEAAEELHRGMPRR